MSGAEIYPLTHTRTHTQWCAFPELMLLYALMSRGNTQDLTAPSYSIWPHVHACDCMCVIINVSFSVTCLCFCLQVPANMDALNVCWHKWMYKMYMSSEGVTNRCEQRQPPPFASLLFSTIFFSLCLWTPSSLSPFFSIPYLYFSLMWVWQPSSIWRSTGVNNGKWLKELSIWAQKKSRVCSCHERMSLSVSVMSFSWCGIDLFLF